MTDDNSNAPQASMSALDRIIEDALNRARTEVINSLTGRSGEMFNDVIKANLTAYFETVNGKEYIAKLGVALIERYIELAKSAKASRY